MDFFKFLKAKELNKIRDLEDQLQRYSAISNVEAERQRIINDVTNLKKELCDLNIRYHESLKLYQQLGNEVKSYEEALELQECGLYTPMYNYERSDEYRSAQKLIIEQQKRLIKNGAAAICGTAWRVEGSLEKGKALIDQFIRLILRAFNGEADALIAKVKWNNVELSKNRLLKSFETVNKLGERQSVKITQEYFDLKMRELVLEYEYNLKKQQEKEELKALQEELREEEKAKRDFERAQKEAEKEEEYYQRALAKVQKEYAASNSSEELREKILTLERELESARDKKERALSMAQQTKRGHVYIISNIGSFGENVFKIGMTRRLDPLDRVRELGDASVPFRFDVHAMIYSNEARTLEYELHKAFAEKALNLFNLRKEFFNVSLEEIEEKVKELGCSSEFSLMPEAMEYKQSLALKNKFEIEVEKRELIEQKFPESLF